MKTRTPSAIGVAATPDRAALAGAGYASHHDGSQGLVSSTMGQPAVSATQIFDAVDADGVTLLVSDGWMVERRQAIFGRGGRGGFVASVEMRTRQRTSPDPDHPGDVRHTIVAPAEQVDLADPERKDRR